jgi:ATP-binding cassette subfamily B protein
MKIYGLRGYFLHKTKTLQDNILKDYQKPMIRYTLLSTASFILVPIAIYFALVHFIADIQSGKYSIGDFTFFLNTLFTFSGQISSILINFGIVYENSFYLNDYFKLMDIKNHITTAYDAYSFPKIEPREIIFDKVSFAYPGSSHLSLQDIDLTIHRGEDIAIVGHNGAGKSSLIKLLLRFYDPSRGRILVDGVDMRQIDIENWYKHLGVLFQDFARYFLTLEENIQLGNIEDKSKGGIEDALTKAQGHELLEILPKGYKQYLGRWFEGGMDMSGGQWQKVAIARSIFRKSPILILDEPTSAIDADAEAAIFNHLLTLYKEQSLLFISHRFSTVRMAEKIVVLEKGRKVEEGTHKQLLQANGLYKRFFVMQKKGYDE